MSNLELLDRIAGNTMCDILGAAAPNLIGAGIWALPTGLGTAPAVALMGLGGASYLASNYLCEPIDVGGTTPVPGVDGCQTVDGYGQLEYDDGSGWKPAGQTGSQQITAQAVSIVEVGLWGPGANGERYSECTFTTVSYGTVKVQAGDTTLATAKRIEWRINPTNGTCSEEGGPGTLPPEVYTPREYTDPVTNCTYNVTFQGFAEVTTGGGVQPVLLIEGAPLLRSDGGRIGGCNFAPTIYMPDGGGGGTTIPGPPGPPPPPVPPGGDDVPWWLGPLLAATGTALLDSIADMLSDSALTPMGAASFTLTAPCDKDAAGNPLKAEWTWDEQPWYERINDQQVVIMQILQQHLDWKTPICRDTPTLEGDYRTISFRSNETSPYGKSRLRKRFRYRSISGNDLSAVVDHWKDFTWEGGPYRVRWVGNTWRTPEVWAASEAEGQRVILHAAREAGFDPLEGGEWRTRLSSSPRLGVPSSLKVDTTGGYYWITARDGSDQRPIVAT